MGYHELHINGKRVGNHVLDPGWTNYKKTVLYVTHDLTDHLTPGKNVLGVMLGRGNHLTGINSILATPGFKTLCVEPKFVEDLDHARTSYNSIHGLINVHWERKTEDTYSLNVQIPTNCKAKVILPGQIDHFEVNGKSEKLRDFHMERDLGIPPERKRGIVLASGQYQLKFRKP